MGRQLCFMLVREKIGKLSQVDANGKQVDRLPIEWYECNKRILHKRTESGREVSLKFLKESPALTQDDVLYAGDDFLIAVDIVLCDAIVIKPATMQEMATLCYEIGNKHLPLFYEDDTLLIPFDKPLFAWLTASGFAVKKEERKLLNPLRTTVAAYAHGDGGSSLFSKILKLTTSNE